MPKAGLSAEKRCTVSEAETALAMGSGSLRVYASPAMVALMEAVCCECIANELEAGQTSVGTALSFRHLAPSPVGAKISARCTLCRVEGRAMEFHVDCFDETGLIGSAEHSRTLVDAVRFQQKADGRIAAS